MSNKNPNYEVLNLIGYGLAKFDNDFVKEFGFTTKSAFYRFCVESKIANTTGTVKNRMDLFDHFFPNNRKGWWQKGDAYIHRKILIDNLFGNENLTSYANIVKLYIKKLTQNQDFKIKIKPILKSKFRKLQETGLEAELYFMNHFQKIDLFSNGILEDARLYGDGYDFQINDLTNTYLAEVKGIRAKNGKFRLTEKEYQRAKEYQNNYVVAVVLNLNQSPRLLTIENPLKQLKFEKRIITSKTITEYHLIKNLC